MSYISDKIQLLIVSRNRLKPTIERIKNLIDQISVLDFSKLREVVVSGGFPTESQEYQLDDAIGDLQYLIELLRNAIEIGLMDHVPFNRRNQIISNLDNLAKYCPRVINNENLSNNVIQEIDRLRDEIRVLGLDYEINKFPSYSAKRQQLNKLMADYADLNAKLLTALDTKNQLDQLLVKSNAVVSEIETKKSETVVANEAIEKINTNLTVKNTELEASFTKANQHIKDINNLKGEIEEFHGIIDSKQKLLTDTIKKSDEIVDKHSKLESQITRLLAKATANNLFKAFGIRADKLVSRIWIWVGGIIISVLVLIAIGIWIAVEFQDRGVDGWFIFKLFITAPVIYALLFFSRQFGNDRKLHEEYSYKSTISLSLPAFREELLKISKQTEGQAENIRIMEKTMEQIFTSPVENISKHPIIQDEDIIDPYKMIATIIKNIKS